MPIEFQVPAQWTLAEACRHAGSRRSLERYAPFALLALEIRERYPDASWFRLFNSTVISVRAKDGTLLADFEDVDEYIATQAEQHNEPPFQVDVKGSVADRFKPLIWERGALYDIDETVTQLMYPPPSHHRIRPYTGPSLFSFGTDPDVQS